MHFSLALDTFQSCLRNISVLFQTVYFSYVSDMHLNYLHIEVLIQTHLSIDVDAFQSCFRQISVLFQTYLSCVSDMHLKYLHIESSLSLVSNNSFYACSSTRRCGLRPLTHRRPPSTQRQTPARSTRWRRQGRPPLLPQSGSPLRWRSPVHGVSLMNTQNMTSQVIQFSLFVQSK